ncbi:MAG TPA: IPT/TIG domain-containing protein [Pyrinomonadaceae bacterium]
MRFNHPYLIAFGVLVLLWILYRILTGRWNPLAVVNGEDGRPSTSKLQLWLWTVVALFSYVAYYSARVNHGHIEAVNEFPRNLLIAMGLSVVTATAAKGITVSNLQNGNLVKPPPSPQTSGPGQVLRDDGGALDLSKIQMLAWTVIAIGTYLITLANIIAAITTNDLGRLPDIDAALMVLMGLGQGAYLGTKLVTTDVPRITGIAPSSGKPPTNVTIRGETFGAAQNGSMVTLDGKPFAVTVVSWADEQIQFTFPATQPDATAWPVGRQVLVGVIVGGVESVGAAPFTVTT